MIECEDEDQLQAYVALGRPLMDYTFFLALTERINTAQVEGNSEEAQRLMDLRAKILEFQAKHDAQVAVALEWAVNLLKEILQTRMNLEMAVTADMLDFAEQVVPEDCCLVPERREELTTEGGLDVAGQLSRVREACQRLDAAGVRVSLFIDADPAQVAAAAECGAPCIEIHTGHFADASTPRAAMDELARIVDALEARRDAAVDVLNDIEGVSCFRPEATFYLWPNVTEAMANKGMNDYDEFRRAALHATGVSFCTRLHFGRALPDEADRYIRFAYSGIDVPDIQEGLARFKAWCES